MKLKTPEEFPRINMVKTGRNIEYLRRMHGFSVKQLQEYLGFPSPQTIYKWQWGESIPSIDNLVILGDLFKIPIERILHIDRPKLANRTKPFDRKRYINSAKSITPVRITPIKIKCRP